MSLVEVEALFFLPLAFALYWLAPRRAAVQNVVLLLLSCLVYATTSKAWLLWLLLGVTVDWVVGRRLEAVPRPADDDAGEAAAAARAVRRRWLWLSMVANVGVLAACKYLGPGASAVGDVLRAFGFAVQPLSWHVLLPLGLSYYTLMKLGYVLDVFYGRRAAERSWLRLAVFTSFFAHVAAGPISRADQLLPQLHAERRLLPENVAAGARLFLCGYALKALAANQLGALLVDPVFARPAAFDAASCWLATTGFALQVFCDFAGYSLIAIGIGRWFGLVLPQNFDLPFLSRSLPEFWRRWHITLNQWLFAFVYTPLVTSRGWWRGRTVAALVLVFVVSGVWHGSQWTFVVWGLMHGLGMAFHHVQDEQWKRLCRQDRRWVQRRRSRGWAVLGFIATQLWFVLSMVPFRAASIGDAGTLAAGLAGATAGGANVLAGIGAFDRLVLALALAMPIGWHLLALPPFAPLRRAAASAAPPLRGIAYGVAIVLLLVFVPVGASTFIYRNF